MKKSSLSKSLVRKKLDLPEEIECRKILIESKKEKTAKIVKYISEGALKIPKKSAKKIPSGMIALPRTNQDKKDETFSSLSALSFFKTRNKSFSLPSNSSYSVRINSGFSSCLPA